MKRILEFFQDGDKQLSSTRLAFLGMSATIGLVWAYVSVTNKKVEEIPPGVAALAATYMLGKVWQMRDEKTPKEGG